MAPEDHEHIARLRALLEVTRLVRGHDDLKTLLAAIARTVAHSLGYRAVVVNLYRPAWDDFEVTTVEGSDAEILLGTTGSRESWQPLLDARFLRRGAFFVPNGEFDWSTLERATVVPDLEMGGARHPQRGRIPARVGRSRRSRDGPVRGRGRRRLERHRCGREPRDVRCRARAAARPGVRARGLLPADGSGGRPAAATAP